MKLGVLGSLKPRRITVFRSSGRKVMTQMKIMPTPSVPAIENSRMP